LPLTPGCLRSDRPRSGAILYIGVSNK
jgi:hypothetical protein